jgi:hypothetical protein
MKFGKCELCGGLRDLHDSHYLPKGGYKRNRAKQLKNPNPVVIVGGLAKQSSLQIRDYKFCDECEQQFNKGGEACVISHIPSDYGDGFAIHGILDVSKAVSGGDGLLYFPEANVPQVDFQKLIYFAMSLFWRGTLKWSPVDGSTPPIIHMTLRQKNTIRNFLLGRGGLSEDMAITVAIWPFKKVPPLCLVPRPDRQPFYRRYWFYYGGFIFVLSLGKNISPAMRQSCAYRRRVLTLSKDLGASVWNAFKTDFERADKSLIKNTLEEIAKIKASSLKTLA